MTISNQIISFAAWAFLPNFATGTIQSIYYSIFIRAGEPKPQPGSTLYTNHRRRIYFSVICAYLLFTIYEADWEIQRKREFYQVLQVPFTATDKEIKSRFRRLAALYHPDKFATSSKSTEANFVYLKLAQDVLLDPVKRFAYERFGPEVYEWERCSSIRDYVERGFQMLLPHYFGTASLLCIFGVLGYTKHGTFWLWLTVSSLFIFESYIISRPEFPWILTDILNPTLTTLMSHPPYLPFQLIQILRKFAVVLHIAISQIAPFFSITETNVSHEIGLKNQMIDLEAKTRNLDLEASRLLSLEMTPFSFNKDSVNMVENKVREWLVQNTIRMDPSVRDAYSKVLKEKAARNNLSRTEKINRNDI